MSGRLGPIGEKILASEKPLLNPKLVQAQADEAKAKQESDQANSFGGLLGNTLKALPSTAVQVAKNVPSAAKQIGNYAYDTVGSVALPGATHDELRNPTLIKDTVLGLPAAAGRLGKQIVTHPIESAQSAIGNAARGVADTTTDALINNFVPKTEREATRAETQGRLGKYLGATPETSLSEGFRMAGATAPAILASGIGGELAAPLGRLGSLGGNTAGFVAAGQAGLPRESSVGERAKQAGHDVAAQALLSTGEAIGKGVLNKAAEAKALYESQTPQERQAGFVKNPLTNEQPTSDSSHIPEEPKPSDISQVQDTSTLASSTPEKLPQSESVGQGRLGSQVDSSLESTIFDPETYVKEQVAKREGAKTAGNPGIIGKAKSFLADTKAKLVDFTSPIEDTLAAAQKKSKFSLLPTDDIHNQIDRVLRSPTLAGQFAKDNGLIDVIKKTDNPDNLDQYLIAKHAIELNKQGITTGRDLTKDQALVTSFAPQYEVEAQKVSQYSKNLLDYSVKTGLISKELADGLKAKYPDYVPFNRVFSEEEISNRSGNKAVASLSKQTAVQNIKGSEREVESPMQSLLAKTNDVFTQGEKNQAAKLLASYEKLPENPFDLKELKPDEHADHTISFFDKGEKRTFSTTKDIAEAAKALNVQQMNILGKMFALPTRVARIGITGINLPFIGANLVKDQITGFINSDKALQTSLANPVNFVKSLFSAVSHNELYEEMVRAGGAGTSFDISRNQVPQTFEQIRASRSIPTRIKYTVLHPGQLLKAVENIVGRSEEATRIQQYRGTKEALLKQGLNKEDAIVGGARQARDATVNFARRGEYGTVLNSAFLYLNAGIQGTRTLLRGLKDRPLQTASKIAVSAMFPVAVATAWNLSDPDRKKAYEDIPEYEKENNIIIIPPHPTQDENGKWNVIKVPLSQEINNIVSLARKPIEQAHGLDPVKFGDFASALLGTVSPIAPTKGAILSTLTPQALKPTIEGATNTNLFTGYPQVSDSLSKLSPEKQIKKDTSPVAIKLGQQLGVSPIKIDAFIKETFGGVGSQLTGQQNVLDAVVARFGKAAGGAAENKADNEVSGLLTKQADKSAELKTKAEAKYQEFKALPKEQAASAFNALIKSDPTLAQKVADVAENEKLGLSYEDKLVRQLQVDNGERAKFIVDKLNKLSSKEEKKKLWEEYTTKKIITKNVAEQVVKLLKP